jgi:hypothetical protein
MKDWEYNVALVLSVICLILAVWIIGAGRANEKLQAKLQVQQADIDRGNMSRQLGSRIVQEMVATASTNREMRAILEKYGFVPPAVPPSTGGKPEKMFSPQGKSKEKNVKSSTGK